MADITQWPGLFSNPDPHDLPPGAAVTQDNLRPDAGKLVVRKGVQPISFAAATGVTDDVIAVGMYRRPEQNYAVFLTSAGKVYYGNKTVSPTTEVESGVSTAYPSCWCQTRQGRLIRVNGLQRGTIYGQQTSSTDAEIPSLAAGPSVAMVQLGITAPAAAPSVAANSTGLTGTYYCAYRYVDADGNASSISPVATITLANQGIRWTLTPSSEARCTNAGSPDRDGTIEMYRSTAGEATTLYLAGTTTGDDTSYDEAVADATLAASTALPIVNPDETLNARRHGVPPKDMSVVVAFQDRYFYTVQARMALGTYTDGTTVPSWATDIVGRYIYREGFEPEAVSAVTDTNTKLTLEISGAGQVIADLVTAGAYVSGNPADRNLIYYCADKETEMLTQRGWLKHDEIVEGDLALSLDPETKKIVWSPIERVNRFPFDGELNHWKSSSIDAMTTDDHRWIASGCGMVGGHHTLRKGGRDKTHFVRTRDVGNKSLVVGGGRPDGTRINPILEDEMVELIGWYLTEGTTPKAGNSIVVSQSRTHNPQYCKRLDRLATHFNVRGCTATACKTAGPIGQWYFGKGVGKYVRRLCPDKQLSPKLLRMLTASQLELLYNTLMAGDGHRKLTRSTETHIWAQKDQGRLDGFQMLCAMLGKRTHSRKSNYFDCTGVTVYRHNKVSARKLTKTKVPYSGIVWCPTTGTGTWMARRNGTTYWTGNSEIDKPESVPMSQNTIIVQENVADHDYLTALAQHGPYMWVFKERHVYRLTFVRQPVLDANVNLAYSRGCVNQRCWKFYEDVLYTFDQFGAWRLSPDGYESISDPIANYWSDGLIDWSKKDWFFVTVEPTQGIVRYHVTLTGESTTRPTRALCYSIGDQAWWTETYPMALAGSCLLEHSNKLRLVVGGQAGKMLLMEEGTTDIVTSATNGTATSDSGAATLIDTGTTFTAAMVGAPVVITSGTGKGQIRYISSIGSSPYHTATVSVAWTTAPTIGSTFTVGAIKAQYKSGIIQIPMADEEREDTGERAMGLVYAPTTAAEKLHASLYWDQETTAMTPSQAQQDGAVTWTSGSTAIDVNIQRARSALNSAPGYARIPFRARAERRAMTRRFVSLALEAYQRDEAITIYNAELENLG